MRDRINQDLTTAMLAKDTQLTGTLRLISVAIKDLQGGASTIMASGEDPAWGADSRHLIFSSGSSIDLLDTQNGKQTPVVTGLGEVSEPTWSH